MSLSCPLLFPEPEKKLFFPSPLVRKSRKSTAQKRVIIADRHYCPSLPRAKKPKTNFQISHPPFPPYILPSQYSLPLGFSPLWGIQISTQNKGGRGVAGKQAATLWRCVGLSVGIAIGSWPNMRRLRLTTTLSSPPFFPPDRPMRSNIFGKASHALLPPPLPSPSSSVSVVRK